MTTVQNRFDINNALDLSRAKQLLAAHKEELANLTTEKAIAWSTGVITELTEEIRKYEFT